MNAIVNFDFEGKGVRVIEIADEPWFVGLDVCRVLEIEKHHQALGRLGDDERGTYTVGTPSGDQQMIVISEPGVYRLVFASRKPAAERFKRWLAHEVLPALRRFGAYVVPGARPPAAAERRFKGDLHPAEVSAWSSAARTAHRLHGRKGALEVWAASPLPQVSVSDDYEIDDPTPVSGRDCLKHLFRISSGKREAVADLYAAALEEPSARNRLEACGMMLGLRDFPDDLVIAAEHPFLAGAFEHTDFAWSWCATLRHLPGARRLAGRVMIDGRLSGGVAVPKGTIAALGLAPAPLVAA